MYLVQADFHKTDKFGRLSLSLDVHKNTAFGRLGRSGPVAFVDGADAVEGVIVHDTSQGWVADVDWTTQFKIEAPLVRAVSPDTY